MTSYPTYCACQASGRNGREAPEMARRETEPTTELGRQLEKERKNRGLTKERWVEVLDCYKPTYLGWLRGTEPSLDNIRHIATVLGVPAVEVFGWIEADRAKAGQRVRNGRARRHHLHHFNQRRLSDDHDHRVVPNRRHQRTTPLDRGLAGSHPSISNP